jgi:hypothetical protein
MEKNTICKLGILIRCSIAMFDFQTMPSCCSNEGHRLFYLVAHPTARKWVITPVINGISKVNPLMTGVITHLLSGMSHQVVHILIP